MRHTNYIHEYGGISSSNRALESSVLSLELVGAEDGCADMEAVAQHDKTSTATLEAAHRHVGFW